MELEKQKYYIVILENQVQYNLHYDLLLETKPQL